MYIVEKVHAFAGTNRPSVLLYEVRPKHGVYGVGSFLRRDIAERVAKVGNEQGKKAMEAMPEMNLAVTRRALRKLGKKAPKTTVRRNPAIRKHPTTEIVREARRRGLSVRVNPVNAPKHLLLVTGKKDIAKARKALAKRRRKPAKRKTTKG